MKKMLVCLLAMACLLFGCAHAQQITMLGKTYTDASSVLTQDAVVSFKASPDCEVNVLPPDEKAMALLEDVYHFVYEEGNRPVRYYDEQTQEKIAQLAGIDTDALHMTEFMALETDGHPQLTVEMNALLDVDYEPGQLVIAVMGVEEADGSYRWFPYLVEVPETGRLIFHVPVEEYEELAGRQAIWHVLALREGARGRVLSKETIEREKIVTPSKSAGDLVEVTSWYATTGAAIEDDFSIFFVDRTQEMEQEMERLAEHMETGSAPLAWFPEEMQRQVQLLHPQGGDVMDMMIYDVAAVKAANYKDDYGDVATRNTFAAAYPQDGQMAAMLGFPIEGATQAPYFNWYTLRAQAPEQDGQVDIVYKQLVIPTMEEEPAMLVVFSEPIDQEDNAK